MDVSVSLLLFRLLLLHWPAGAPVLLGAWEECGAKHFFVKRGANKRIRNVASLRVSFSGYTCFCRSTFLSICKHLSLHLSRSFSPTYPRALASDLHDDGHLHLLLSASIASFTLAFPLPSSAALLPKPFYILYSPSVEGLWSAKDKRGITSSVVRRKASSMRKAVLPDEKDGSAMQIFFAYTRCSLCCCWYGGVYVRLSDTRAPFCCSFQDFSPFI